MLQEHGIAAVIYGGTYVDEDFRDRKVADEWFEAKYKQRLLAKDMEATTKYRYRPEVQHGRHLRGELRRRQGPHHRVQLSDDLQTEDDRLSLHENLVVKHYLAQFNEETIVPRRQHTCGEPCAAVCKKMKDDYKKDYEPYQAMGPLCGVFDQRAAERLCHHADALGFDAISVGGVMAWMMDLLDAGELVQGGPRRDAGTPVEDGGVRPGCGLRPQRRARAWSCSIPSSCAAGSWTCRRARANGEGSSRGRAASGSWTALSTWPSDGRAGWSPTSTGRRASLRPCPSWASTTCTTASLLRPPRTLGRLCAERFQKELLLDTAGFCRFHRGWAEDTVAEVFGSIFGMKDQLLASTAVTATRINSRNASVYWESERNIDLVLSFLKRTRDVEGETDPQLTEWITRFEKDRKEAALDWWFEMRKGVDESLREF